MFVFGQGTLQVEVKLASGVSGVVTRDTKGSAQGMITVTDGSSLDMPIHLKFPKVRVLFPLEQSTILFSRKKCGKVTFKHPPPPAFPP